MVFQCLPFTVFQALHLLTLFIPLMPLPAGAPDCLVRKYLLILHFRL